MSDDVLSVIPTDPYWQPERAAADRAAALATALAPGRRGGLAPEIQVNWHDRPNLVDCGAYLEWITCPHCSGMLDPGWWTGVAEAHATHGFDPLAADLPCCGTASTLDALNYHWPCVFARFEIAIWNTVREPFTDDELTTFAEALGHPVRQIIAHI
ncbi:hypothetical protein C1I98_31770 [Spongiactinospora gelatinilytica]|uniref:Uncharacterized protein n=1 Tax=Spongiactinospora gelatinilytica TaxID=2666298 RepID=A0A2W2F3B0_9ACTN|nr:hypothetical protein [Spongiactinospora gelatinilytica]PZG29623.1 hypothetical protein C1I98_31770 [Spongiactinospora gelatinilytica]